jgi:fumarate reductase flavoprotein subunit
VSGGDLYIAHRGVIMSDRNFPSPPFTSIAASVDPRYRMPWEIEVNKLGIRYVSEDADLDTLERAQTNQPGMACWVIWDQEIYDKAPPLFRSLTKEQQSSAFSRHPMFARGDTIEEVARKMALPPAALAATVKSYNQAVANKSDPKFGRTHMPLPLSKPPFYAVECLGSSVFGHAGLDIDGSLRVQTAEKQPIKNLYAAGEITGGWHCSGDVVVNGCMVTPALTFGRLLGEKLLKFRT